MHVDVIPLYFAAIIRKRVCIYTGGFSCAYPIKFYFSLPFRCVRIRIDGKKNPLIIKVSKRIPIAMMKPNKNSSCKGWVINTENVAARINPADEMTPPEIGRAHV